MKKMKSNLMLLLTAFIWSCGFVAQRLGMDAVGPWTFGCLRNLIGGTTLLLLMPVLDKVRGNPAEADWHSPSLLKGGIACGIALAAASMMQQFGILYTTVGKAGFITSLYVVLVPLLSLFLGRRVRKIVWLSAAIAVCGLYFLSMSESALPSRGDLLVLVSAFLFSIHIMVIDYFSPLADGVRLSCLQFFTAGIICLVPMLLLEKPALAQIIAGAGAILFSGVLSSGAAYTLQIVAQRDADPTAASLILSLEAVFAALTGFLILHQSLSLRELGGCVLMFAAIILAQLPERKKNSPLLRAGE